MEFDNLKSNWKEAGIGKKTPNELLMMTQIKNHPYYDAFDGATKPLWSNLLLIGSTGSFIIVRFVGWLVLRNPINGDNLKTSLITFQNKLRRIAISVLLTSLLFGSAIILFFSSSIDFTGGKYFMLAGMALSLTLLVYLSSRNWFKRVEGINTTLLNFNNSTD